MKTLSEIRNNIEHCRNTDNLGCITLTEYRDKANVEGASHPVLFQTVSRAKIMLIGAEPGSIDADTSKAVYQSLVNAQFSLGHKSAVGLGEIMMRVGKIRQINLPLDITRIPITEDVQNKHLLARERLGLHITNLVKCHAPTSWETDCSKDWQFVANACTSRHLMNEIEAIDPPMIILLGQQVLDYVAKRESWAMRRKDLKISTWAANQAGYLRCFGKERFVTAWAHPGGNYFSIPKQGKMHWDLYAKQIAAFVR